MDKQVLLTLTGLQRDPSGSETVTELSTEAECYERNGSLYILYEERAEDGSLTKNIIKYKNQLLELTKKGAVSSCMVFEPGREHMADYVTPFGLLKLGILTASVTMQCLEDQTEIVAEYSLTEYGEVISHCKIIINIHNLGI